MSAWERGANAEWARRQMGREHGHRGKDDKDREDETYAGQQPGWAEFGENQAESGEEDEEGGFGAHEAPTVDKHSVQEGARTRDEIDDGQRDHRGQRGALGGGYVTEDGRIGFAGGENQGVVEHSNHEKSEIAPWGRRISDFPYQFKAP